MPTTNNPNSKRSKDDRGAGSHDNIFETQFFLYTPKLNENATKNLRKASTNKEERQVLG